MGTFAKLSRNIPFCPVCPLLSFLRERGEIGTKSTNGDKTGHFGTIWETPPFTIHPHLALYYESVGKSTKEFYDSIA